MSLWEGGTRGASFVSGGILPVSVRGTVSMGLIAVADWCKMMTRLSRRAFRLANLESL